MVSCIKRPSFLDTRSCGSLCQHQGAISHSLFISLHITSYMVTVVTFLLHNSVSDLGNPDCLDFYVSWNKNLEKDQSVSVPSAKGLCLFLNDHVLLN